MVISAVMNVDVRAMRGAGKLARLSWNPLSRQNMTNTREMSDFEIKQGLTHQSSGW